mmetsp:Transcript_10674/g.15702  ORF Transcript_10674/g.15702 Transcript_10674/m.15702 type:complete len:415 (+) Transcript_10674:105-1349(+)|eukprot:CAMPEP_0194203282 /NCGR_PEP_ID=MMETSP0156-20130528/3102_1 /TAXON_ID=33649 /ORGANISM="Thalassionema nitzschioides, Strain L26-B" /LENGTH=414 /DNA_ID=CAMNT_0038928995 /DNA_START=45 /DNA_END=1289 /DNA_ORIENTATION=+
MPFASDELQIRNAQPKLLLQIAQDIVSQITGESSVVDDAVSNSVVQVAKNEILKGRAIGRGGFCTVREVTVVQNLPKKEQGRLTRKSNFSPFLKLTSNESSSQKVDSLKGEVPFTKKTKRKKKENSSYVIKQVSDELIHENRVTFLKATVDLALEVRYLTALNHPNIIEARGVSASGPFSLDYFVVLDRLQYTLPVKLKRWMTTDRQCKGVTGVFAGGKKKIDSLLVDRLATSYFVASALDYLHSLNLIYRDIKPDNIGFDCHGNVKLFDFGLLRETNNNVKTKSGFYKLTGFTGSIRYMAPEVGLHMPYNQSADIYSFSMLLWYIMALEPPYGFYSPEMIISRVFQEGDRPVTMVDWPEELSQMMEKSWSSRIKDRPDFRTVMEVIKRTVEVVDPEQARKLDQHYTANAKTSK